MGKKELLHPTPRTIASIVQKGSLIVFQDSAESFPWSTPHSVCTGWVITRLKETHAEELTIGLKRSYIESL